MRLGFIWAVVTKEARDLLANRLLLAAVVFPALIFAAIPTGIVAFIEVNELDPNQLGEIEQYISQFPDLDPKLAAQGFIVLNFMAYFLLIPAMVPMAIATQSVIGEKTARSLEPQLATPMEVSELLIGKAISAATPAVLATWAVFLAYGFVNGAIAEPVLTELIFNDVWRVAMISLVPLICLLSVLLGIIVSSRVNDARAAQQIGGFIVIPVIAVAVAGFFSGQASLHDAAGHPRRPRRRRAHRPRARARELDLRPRGDPHPARLTAQASGARGVRQVHTQGRCRPALRLAHASADQDAHPGRPMSLRHAAAKEEARIGARWPLDEAHSRPAATTADPSGGPVLDLPGVIQRVPGRASDGVADRPRLARVSRVCQRGAGDDCLQRIGEGGSDELHWRAGRLVRGRRRPRAQLAQVGDLGLADMADHLRQVAAAAARSLRQLDALRAPRGRVEGGP